MYFYFLGIRQAEQPTGSSDMETSRREKCKKQMEQLCFHIKDNLEFAENGKESTTQLPLWANNIAA
jgi:hypothetical protein